MPVKTHPIAQIDFSQRAQHTIEFFDQQTPNSRAKPRGVHGAEIRYRVGGASPLDPSELPNVVVDTATPHVVVFNGADIGKVVYYQLRWVNTRQEPGPWSPIYSATIAG